MNKLKTILPDVLAIVFFILIGFAYFFKPISEGWVLTGHDHTGGTGSGSELTEYYQRTGVDHGCGGHHRHVGGAFAVRTVHSVPICRDFAVRFVRCDGVGLRGACHSGHGLRQRTFWV